jgi:hypothetical protein
MCRTFLSCKVTTLHRHEACADCGDVVFVDYCDAGMDECSVCDERICPKCADHDCNERHGGHHLMVSDGYEPKSPPSDAWAGGFADNH